MKDLTNVIALIESTGISPRIQQYSEGSIIFLRPVDNPVITIPEGHSMQFTFDKQGKMIGMVLHSDYSWRPLGEQRPDSGVDLLVLENANREYNAPMRNTPRVARYNGDPSSGFTYSDGQARSHQALNVTHWMPLRPLPL